MNWRPSSPTRVAGAGRPRRTETLDASRPVRYHPAVPSPTSPIERLRDSCLSLPEAYEKQSHGEPTFWVGKRMFATFADAANHHGGGRHAVWCKSDFVTQDLLVRSAPDRYYIPPYVGPSGWLGIYLDRRPSWKAVEERLQAAYLLVAPKRLAAALR